MYRKIEKAKEKSNEKVQNDSQKLERSQYKRKDEKSRKMRFEKS